MNNNLSRFADSKVYFQCPICTKSMDIQGNSLICRHGHCFDISRYGYVNLLLKSSPKTNYSKRSFDNRHQILEYGMYDVVLETYFRLHTTKNFSDCYLLTDML